jgi:hypothetical protein
LEGCVETVVVKVCEGADIYDLMLVKSRLAFGLIFVIIREFFENVVVCQE